MLLVTRAHDGFEPQADELVCYDTLGINLQRSGQNFLSDPQWDRRRIRTRPNSSQRPTAAASVFGGRDIEPLHGNQANSPQHAVDAARAPRWA